MLREAIGDELGAAVAVARRSGLGKVSPRLLHLGSHTTAALDPLAIVARIASGSSFNFSDGSIERELEIARRLSERGAPIVPPAIEVHPGPYLEAGCAITLWQLIDGRQSEGDADAALAAEALRRLHRAMSELDDLPPFTGKVQGCERILADPHQAQKLTRADRDFLREQCRALQRRLTDERTDWRPIHGDAHLGNVLIAQGKAIWLDLESICVGSIEWDVASLPRETWGSFGELDARRLILMSEIRSLCVATWCWAEYGRSEATNEAAVYHLQQLRLGEFG